ncbi:MAG: hypothetical protein IIZ33_07560 [Erysipelotrichaceae bacterium]|nr:hypothetical protein [Erysipelotrichaceae bacterium]
MGKCHFNFYSEYLKRNVDIDVILPEEYGYGRRQKGHPIEKDFPVLYLLHGYNSDFETWERNSTLPFQLRDLPLAVVLPSGYNLWYGNGEKTGMDYTSFLAHELPAVLKNTVNISDRREDTFIGGLSMGGFGAVLLGLKYPEKYSRVISLSGVTDLDLFYADDSFKTAINRDRDISLGKRDDLRKNHNDFEMLLEEGREKGTEFPEFYIACGIEDPVAQYSWNFKEKLKKYQVPFQYVERTGNHNWVFWEEELPEVLSWLPLKKYGKEDL